MKTALLSFALISFLFISCGDKKEGASAPPGSKFGVKAGMAEMTMDMMGMKTSVVNYWDDFGSKMHTQVSGEMMGMKMNETTIEKDGYSFKFDAEKKSGTKRKGVSTDMHFHDMTPEQLKEKGMTEIGTESVLGKECKVYELDVDQMTGSQPGAGQPAQMKGKLWIWQGIPMKMEMGELMKMEATKLEVMESVPASKFEVPADITITDEPEPDSVLSPH